MQPWLQYGSQLFQRIQQGTQGSERSYPKIQGDSFIFLESYSHTCMHTEPFCMQYGSNWKKQQCHKWNKYNSRKTVSGSHDASSTVCADILCTVLDFQVFELDRFKMGHPVHPEGSPLCSASDWCCLASKGFQLSLGKFKGSLSGSIRGHTADSLCSIYSHC